MISQSVKRKILELRRRGGICSKRVNQCFFLGVKDVENSKPIFDPDFHTELIIKNEYEDCNLGNMFIYIKIEKNTFKL